MRRINLVFIGPLALVALVKLQFALFLTDSPFYKIHKVLLRLILLPHIHECQFLNILDIAAGVLTL